MFNSRLTPVQHLSILTSERWSLWAGLCVDLQRCGLWCRWVSGWSTCLVSRSRRWRRIWTSSMTVWRCTTPATAGRRWRRPTASSALPNPNSGDCVSAAPSAAHLHTLPLFTETLDRLAQAVENSARITTHYIHHKHFKRSVKDDQL